MCYVFLWCVYAGVCVAQGCSRSVDSHSSIDCRLSFKACPTPPLGGGHAWAGSPRHPDPTSPRGGGGAHGPKFLEKGTKPNREPMALEGLKGRSLARVRAHSQVCPTPGRGEGTSYLGTPCTRDSRGGGSNSSGTSLNGMCICTWAVPPPCLVPMMHSNRR